MFSSTSLSISSKIAQNSSWFTLPEISACKTIFCIFGSFVIHFEYYIFLDMIRFWYYIFINVVKFYSPFTLIRFVLYWVKTKSPFYSTNGSLICIIFTLQSIILSVINHTSYLCNALLVGKKMQCSTSTENLNLKQFTILLPSIISLFISPKKLPSCAGK